MYWYWQAILYTVQINVSRQVRICFLSQNIRLYSIVDKTKSSEEYFSFLVTNDKPVITLCTGESTLYVYI